MKKILLIVSLLFMSACAPEKQIDNTPTLKNSEAMITVMDVGQGSSAVVQSGDDVVLIDAGEKENGEQIVSTLKSLGIDEIDIAIGTHPHTDHIGGMSVVLDAVKVKELYVPEVTSNSYAFEKMLRTAEKQNVSVKTPNVGETLPIGDGSMTFLGPKKDANYGDNMNAYSIITRFEFGVNAYLTGGDADELAVIDLMNSGGNIQSTIFQAFHHGSSNKTNTPELLDAIYPTDVIISCGLNNSYGHPHQELLQYANEKGKNIYRTDRDGVITIAFRDNTYSITVNKTVELEEPKTEAYLGKVIGNKNSKIYHREDCGNLPFGQNQVLFNTVQEAMDAGYRASNECFNNK